MNKPLAKVEDQLPAVADATSILAVIERAAKDPSTDVDKLERLLGVYERITAKQGEALFANAMNQAQSEVRQIATDLENKSTRSRYASYPALDKALRPIYSQHGFSLSFDTAELPTTDFVRVLCHVSHSGGFTRTYRIDMPADGKGAKGGDVMTKTHATGSAISYGMRYLLKMIFNVATGDGDDDGNAAGVVCVSENEAANIEALVTEVAADLPKFLKYIGASEVRKIPAAKYKTAIAALEKKRKQA